VPALVDDLPTHFLIPDTQTAPGRPVDHLDWIGQYIVDHLGKRRRVRIIMIGDWWTFDSLSSYDKGKRQMEGRRVMADVDAGNDAMARLLGPTLKLQAKQRAAHERVWDPQLDFFMGNHEYRMVKAVDDMAQLEGLLDERLLDLDAWTVHPFLQPAVFDGVRYAHYHYNPANGRPYSGMIETRIKNVGASFTQGHQQTLMYGLRPGWGQDGQPTMVHGLVAGSCYLHNESYLGPQGNASWRGVVVCHNVHGGTYSPMFVDLDYLCRRYEGKGVEAHLGRSIGMPATQPRLTGIEDWSNHTLGGHQ
jgi:hypothetical protein